MGIVVIVKDQVIGESNRNAAGLKACIIITQWFENLHNSMSVFAALYMSF